LFEISGKFHVQTALPGLIPGGGRAVSTAQTMCANVQKNHLERSARDAIGKPR
jgi:hypothetical protein